jgi:AcrR family transcriptional regulator
MSERRDELVDKALGYLLQNGVAGLSLRPLAKDIGTSARLLVYHFESKDGLIAAVMGEVQARMRRSFAELQAPPTPRQAAGALQAFWAWIIRPQNLPYLRLLLEVQVLAIQQPSRYASYLEGTSSGWLDLIERSLPPLKARRAVATLCVAVVDGLLLECLSTGDRRRTTEALRVFAALLAGDGAGKSGRGTTNAARAGRTRASGKGA